MPSYLSVTDPFSFNWSFVSTETQRRRELEYQQCELWLTYYSSYERLLETYHFNWSNLPNQLFQKFLRVYNKYTTKLVLWKMYTLIVASTSPDTWMKPFYIVYRVAWKPLESRMIDFVIGDVKVWNLPLLSKLSVLHYDSERRGCRWNQWNCLMFSNSRTYAWGCCAASRKKCRM